MSDLSKRALEDSLKKILKTKPLDKITVKELTEDCGISRMTFYYHFRDIYDLVEWSCEYDAHRILHSRPTYENWQEDYLEIFKEIYRDSDFIYNVYHSDAKEKIDRYLYARTYELIYDVIEKVTEGKKIPEEYVSFYASFYKHGFVGLVKDWLEDGMKEDPKEIVAKCSRLLDGSLSTIFDI